MPRTGRSDEDAADAAGRRARNSKYLSMVGTNARLRRDQVDDLAVLTRRLTMRRRWQPDERITSVALIRVAVDLLLRHCDQLRGDTEDELRDSIIEALRTARRPGDDLRADEV